MREFIERNGETFAHPPEGLDVTARTIEDRAAALISEADFIEWVSRTAWSAALTGGNEFSLS
jgi:hypothetical protein